ncbi:shematrin-like protein 1 [Malaya genurostris]|uniref:shematrin-like protein 1 n=1 Tax=Malaya genurostris TaxID=325434 RepID=UPI0026F38717|nr:shematrin-like protein 1 [Malaya genurostris]
MKFVTLVTILVLGTVYSAPTDDEHIAGPKSDEAAEERIFDLSRKSRQLLGSSFGYSPYGNGINQGIGGIGGYPYSYNQLATGYSAFPAAGGYPYGGYGGGQYGGYGGLYGNGLYSNGGLYGGNGLGFSPLAGAYSSTLYNGAQPLYNDPYSPFPNRGFFPGSPYYRRPY